MNKEQEEIWKPLPDFEDLYEISNMARVRNRRGIILRENTNQNGYFYVHLRPNGKTYRKYLHLTVTKCFLNKPDYGKYKCLVDHIDGDKTNNKLSNLHYVTTAYNTLKQKRKKLPSSGYQNVYWHNPTKKWMASLSLHKMKKSIGYYNTPEEANEAAKLYKEKVLQILKNGDFNNEEFKRQKPYYRKRLSEGLKDL